MSAETISISRPHVLIESGRCSGGDTRNFIGRWIYLVSYVDEDGAHLTDYVGLDRDAADSAAVSWARDMGCRIVDRSTEEPA
ncbi:hypothetical protein ACP4J4_20295 (plasmid) [Aureimonas ureilytica]|uniref:hypothetical protein n=1 Tax=Aureimonas ureilytica TaxID=401562 RepID=UPI003CF2513E